MFCFRVKKQLIPYMEKTLDQKRMDAVARHLSKCARCSEELELIKRASGAFRSAKAPAQEPAADLWSRIECEITAAPAPSARKWPVSGLQFAGIAAAAVIILIAVISVSKIREKPRNTMLRQTSIVQKPSDAKYIPLEPESPARVNTTLAKRTAAKKAENAKPVSMAEQTGQSITNKHILKHNDTVLMASLPKEYSSKAVGDGVAPELSELNSATRSAGSSAANCGNIGLQDSSKNDILDNGRAANRIQNSGNICKAGQNMDEEVASAPARNSIGNIDGEITKYEAVLDKNPHDTATMSFLVFAYARVGNQDARAQIARRLIAAVPAESSDWNRELGSALAALGDKAGAMSAWRNGLEYNPISDSSGILKEAASAGMLDSLAKYYQQKSSSGKIAAPSLILANIYEFRGDFERAAKVRKKLTGSFPQNQHYWLLLGEDLLKTGDKANAKTAFTKAAGMKDNQSIRALAMKRLKELK
ncbi:MAG: hypothetical protein ABFD64_07095 [Armatimonadota bacterium]